MNRKSPRLVLFAVILSAMHLPASSSQAAPAPVTVTVDLDHLGAAISPYFSGLSFETSLERPGDDGKRYFSADNKPLVTLFRTLGIRNLRVGGNTADRADLKAPDDSDIDALFGFAKAAGVNVIYTVRLKNGDPQADAQTIKYIADRYALQVLCYAIGNEPNVFAHGYTYDAYSAAWKTFYDAIVAQVPNAMFCGPSTTPGKGAWVRSFAAQFGPTGHIAFVTQHAYPGGAGNKVTDPVAGRAKLLSASIENTDQDFYDGFVPAALAASLKYRIEEENNFFNGGAKDVSDTFASALWGLDFMYWWASHGCEGLNFHTGDFVSAGQKLNPCKYTAYMTAPGGAGYDVHPLGYGIKAFDLGAHGRIAPVKIENAGGLNLTAYAVLNDDRSLCVTLINKELAPGTPDAAAAPNPAGSRDARVTIDMPGYGSAKTIFLTAPGSDVAAKTGITLGGASIKDDGAWEGNWTSVAGSNGRFVMAVPAASAVVVKLEP